MPEQENIWEIEIENNIYEATTTELEQWIREGRVQPDDKIRRGKLPWTAARNIPTLRILFEQQPAEVKSISPSISPNRLREVSPFCVNHQGVPAHYICQSCSVAYCRNCPEAINITTRLCPRCRSLCKSYETYQKELEWNKRKQTPFGISDLVEGLTYPFTDRFGFLVTTAIIIICTVLGKFSGYFNFLAIGIGMAYVTITIQRVSDGVRDGNLLIEMSDITSGARLATGVAIVTYGYPILASLGIFYLLSNLSSSGSAATSLETTTITIYRAESLTSEESNEGKIYVVELERGRFIDSSIRIDEEGRKLTKVSTGGEVDALDLSVFDISKDDIWKAFEEYKLQEKNLITGRYIKEISEDGASGNVFKDRILKESIPFYAQLSQIFILLVLTIAWITLYYPVALIVAGYSRYFWSVINPLVGFDTIKRMGGTYWTLLGLYLAISLLSQVTYTIVVMIFNAGIGDSIVKSIMEAVIGKGLSTYFSLVLAYVIGTALFKAADKMGIGHLQAKPV